MRVSSWTAEYDLYKIQVYARTRDSYYTFCTPECKKAIDEYRTFREIHGETIDKNSPLIRELFDTRVRFAAAKPKPVKIEGLETLMHRILLRSEVKSADVMRSHGFRKFFVSHCIKSRMDYNIREYLTGHRHSRGLDIHYDRTTEEDRLEEYVKAIPMLTIDQSQRLQTRVKELESGQAQEIANLRAEVRAWEPVKEELLKMAEELRFSNKESKLRMEEIKKRSSLQRK